MVFPFCDNTFIPCVLNISILYSLFNPDIISLLFVGLGYIFIDSKLCVSIDDVESISCCGITILILSFTIQPLTSFT
jgi:hypothetical protein